MTSTSTAPRSQARHDCVLDALRGSPDPMTVPQLAQRCGCSEVSVRRSLRTLIAAGLVEHVGNERRYDDRNKLRWGRGHSLYTA